MVDKAFHENEIVPDILKVAPKHFLDVSLFWKIKLLSS